MKKTVIWSVGGIFLIALVITLLVTMTSSAHRVLLKTSEGDIVIELATNMPITTGNFEKLVKQGYYDNTIFHRVIEGFMIQGGDPTGTGRGGPGYRIKDEFVQGSTNVRGTISMANAGPGTGGSQFFINVVDNTFLDWDKPPASSRHPAFGHVVEGMDIVDNIAGVDTDRNDKPLKNVTIIKATMIK